MSGRVSGLVGQGERITAMGCYPVFHILTTAGKTIILTEHSEDTKVRCTTGQKVPK